MEQKTTKSSETKKAIILLVIAALFILSIPVIMWMDYQRSVKTLEEYNSYYAEGETNVIYLGKENCGYCEQFSPVLEAISKEYHVTYHYINISALKNNHLSQVVDRARVTHENFGTPTLVITKNGEVVASRVGAMDRETLFSFLQTNEVIDKDAVLKTEFPNLTNIDYSQYTNLLASNERSVIVIGQTGCTHCTNAKPALDEIALENNIPIYYLNYTNITSEERAALQSSLSYFEENPRWGTPLYLVVENNELVDVTSGFTGKETVVNFLKKSNIIKK